MNISGQQGIYRLVSAVCFLLLTAVSCSGSSQQAAPVQQPAVGATAQPSPEVIYLHYNERPPYLVTTQNGDKYYFQAKIMSFKVGVGSVDSITTATCTLELTTNSAGVGIIESLAA